VRDIYEKKSVDTFATGTGKQSYSTSAYYEETMSSFDTSDLPVPSWEFYAAAEDEPIPSYRVEPASSDRSQCVQKGTACKHGAEKPHSDAFIAKGATRIGSFDKEGGSYTRWVHLGCFRVPAKVWRGLPDPETCSDASQFAKALHSMNEVLLCGYGDLSPGAQGDFVQHVMSKDNWAKERKASKPIDEQLEEAEAQLRELEGSLDGLPEGKETDRVLKAQAKAQALKANLEKKKAEAEEKQKNARSQIGKDIPVFSEGFGSATRESSSTTMTNHTNKEKFVIPVPGRDGDANVLRGKTCVMTGVFPEVGGGAGLNLGKEKVKAMIESFGGRVTSSISGQTNILIVGKSPGMSKVSQARSKSSVMMLSLVDIANGIKVGLIEAPKETLQIDSFSAGYTFKSGISNGLAGKASQKQLMAAAGYAPQAVKAEAEGSSPSPSSSGKGKLSAPKKAAKVKAEKVERAVKVKPERVVKVKAEKVERAVKVKPERVVKVKDEKVVNVVTAVVKAEKPLSKAAQAKAKRAQAAQADEEKDGVDSTAMVVVLAASSSTSSGRSTRQSTRRAAGATLMLTN